MHARRRLCGLVLLLCLSLISCRRGPEQSVSLETVGVDGSFFSMRVPAGWTMRTAGACDTFSLLLYDARRPLRQIFYFTQLGPVYTHPLQAKIDQAYVDIGGDPQPWMDMPLLSPVTPSAFIEQLPRILQSRLVQDLELRGPILDGIEVVAETQVGDDAERGERFVVRAIFTRDGQVGEGLFSLVLSPWKPYTTAPGGGVDMGILVVGFTASEADFPALVDDFAAVVGGLVVNDAYVNHCADQQTSNALLRPDRMLRTIASDMQTAWNARTEQDNQKAEALRISMGREPSPSVSD